MALLGIDLVLCGAVLHLLTGRFAATWQVKWAVAIFFVFLWLPVGPSHLPMLAYVRGVTSDLSITLVVLACLNGWRCICRLPPMAWRETMGVNAFVAVAAVFLYPLALGWGDWDAYRLGWGSFGLWISLLAISGGAWFSGLRVLPVLIGLALLGWAAGLMESSNLWDYLVDPWLAIAALVQCVKVGVQALVHRHRLPLGLQNR